MNDEKLDTAVNTHILYNMSRQMMRELEDQTFVADAIAEATRGAALDDDDADDEIMVYEWWLITDGFAHAAKQAGEIIVETPFGTIWGRQTTGQRISQDINVQEIFKTMREI